MFAGNSEPNVGLSELSVGLYDISQRFRVPLLDIIARCIGYKFEDQ